MNTPYLNYKVGRKAEKLEKKLRKFKGSLPAKLFCILLGTVSAAVVFFLFFYNASKWFDEYKVVFSRPIEVKFNAPIRVMKRSGSKKTTQEKASGVDISGKETEFEIINEKKYGQILWRIYQIETQRGKTDGCRLNGDGYGGFGVMYQGEVVCYKTFREAVDRANYWLEKMNPDESLVGALCQWNTGTAGLVNCSYYQTYLSL
jgi:hypothetical protein